MRFLIAASMAAAFVSWAGVAQASQSTAPLLSDPLALEQVQLNDNAGMPEVHQVAQVGVQVYFGGGYRGGYYGHGHHHHHGYNRSYNRYYGHGGYYRGGGYGGGYRGGYGGYGGGCRW